MMKFPDSPEATIKVEAEMTRDELDFLISDLEDGAWHECSKEFLDYLRRL